MVCFVGKTASTDSEHLKCTDVVVPRKELMENIEKIDYLELQLSQQVSERSFELNHAHKQHTLQIQKICDDYEEIVKRLQCEYKRLELKSKEEQIIMSSAMDDKSAEHATKLIQLEAKLNEKVLTESDKAAAIQLQMSNLRSESETALRQSTDLLRETTKNLESSFSEQLTKREKQIQTLYDEIQTKKTEFYHYCNQLNLDNDRAMAQLNLDYETRLKKANDNLLKWRNEANILTKRIDNTSTSCNQLRSDIGILLDEHTRNKKHISQLEQNIAELQRDIDIRNKLVTDKETCLMEAIDKIKSADKMKKFLNERAIELEAEIEPLNEQIKQNCTTIQSMEHSKKTYQHKIDDLNIDIELLKSRCKAITFELKNEKARSMQLQTTNQRMCADMEVLVKHTHDYPQLKKHSLEMYHKYVIHWILLPLAFFFKFSLSFLRVHLGFPAIFLSNSINFTPF